MSDLIRVGITHGDYNGIGYEVILKSLSDPAVLELFTPVIFGIPSLANQARELLKLEDIEFNEIERASDAEDGVINLVKLTDEEVAPSPGEITPEAGEAAALALDYAVEALQNEEIDVLVTAPISKEAIQNERFQFPGHTEYLEYNLGEGSKAMMILCNDSLRVALLTIHVPLAKVAEMVTEDNIISAVKILNSTLKKDFACERPSIAVLSLNPHAGDGGVIGDEEEEVIKPSLEKLRQEGILVFGPYPADGFFGHASFARFDGVLAIYHDQGLAPFKTIAEGGGVNFTAGLPFVRTSPDHGTAFDIAWKGIADETSMRQAIYMAIDIFRNRTIFEEANENPLKKYINERPDRGERQDKPVKKSPLMEESDD